MSPAFIDPSDQQVRVGSHAAELVGRLISGARGDALASRADASALLALLSYRLAWFEAKPPEGYPAQALAALTTHDLPTAAGVWTGADLAASEVWIAQVAADRARGARYAEAAEITAAALAPLAGDVALLVPALGPMW